MKIKMIRFSYRQRREIDIGSVLRFSSLMSYPIMENVMGHSLLFIDLESWSLSGKSDVLTWPMWLSSANTVGVVYYTDLSRGAFKPDASPSVPKLITGIAMALPINLYSPLLSKSFNKSGVRRGANI